MPNSRTPDDNGVVLTLSEFNDRWNKMALGISDVDVPSRPSGSQTAPGTERREPSDPNRPTHPRRSRRLPLRESFFHALATAIRSTSCGVYTSISAPARSSLPCQRDPASGPFSQHSSRSH